MQSRSKQAYKDVTLFRYQITGFLTRPDWEAQDENILSGHFSTSAVTGRRINKMLFTGSG